MIKEITKDALIKNNDFFNIPDSYKEYFKHVNEEREFGKRLAKEIIGKVELNNKPLRK
jgi:hypothetical protein